MRALAYDIVGEVRDQATRHPLDFVNISILKQGETTPHGTITDEEGAFVLTGLGSGTYTITISFMGYTSVEKVVHLKGADHNIGKIYLSEDTQNLQEVEVVGQGTTVRFELDKKVFSIDQNIAAAGASASEALENLPSVDVDQEGNVSLRGSESVEIWINGKPSGLTAENRADVLRQMPAESIKEIEVITNPSAKFSPEGTSGVINIVMKKDRKAGYYGSWTVGAEYALAAPWNKPPGANTSLNINFSKGIVDGYANVGYRFNSRKGSNWSHREMDKATQWADGVQSGNGHGMFLRTGLNLQAGEHSTFGVSGFGMLSEPKAFCSNNENYIDYLLLDKQNGDTLRQYRREENVKGWHPGGNATVDYQLKYHQHELMVSATYNHWTWNNDQWFGNRQGGLLRSSETQYSRNRDQSVEVKADYEWKPTQKSRLQAGYQMRWSNKTSLADAYNDAAQELYDFYTDFRTREQNHSIYLTYGNKFWDRLSLQVGLRGELQTRHMESFYKDADGKIIDAYEQEHMENRRDTLYLQIYPSVYLSYDFGNGHELQLNYTRRVDRPWGHLLNPRQNLADSTNISCGNPDLLPSYSNNTELNYLKIWERHTISAGAFWRYKENVVQGVTFIDGEQMRSTWVNAGNRHELGGEVTVKNRLFKELLQVTTSIECYYNLMKGGEYDFLYASRPHTIKLNTQSTVTWSAKLQLNFLFTKTFSGQISGRYRSPRVLAQGETSHSYNIDLGLRKTFLNKQLALALNVRDLLNSRARRSTTWGDGFWQESKRQWNSRSISLTLTYNFGNMNKKKDEKNNYHSNDAAGGAFDEGAGAEGGAE